MHKCLYNSKKIDLRNRNLLKIPLSLGLESSVSAGAELSEIDARLQALQEYMRDLDTGH